MKLQGKKSGRLWTKISSDADGHLELGEWYLFGAYYTITRVMEGEEHLEPDYLTGNNCPVFSQEAKYNLEKNVLGKAGVQ